MRNLGFWVQLIIELKISYLFLTRFVSESWAPKSRLLGSFCGGQDDVVVEATSGVLAVYYVDDYSVGFNASFSVLECPYHCSDPNRRCDESGDCVCKDGLGGKRF